MNRINQIHQDFLSVKAKRNLLRENFDENKKKIEVLRTSVEDLVKARWVITEVQRLTQEKFKDKFENLISLAIQNVYDRPITFHLEFERKRNQMECSISLKETVNGKERIFSDIEYDVGGGMIDIISFVSRIVLWNLEKPRSRNVIILDEPMKNMGKLIDIGGQILREISHKLKFQLIIVTHDQALIEISDKAWQVEHDGNKSHIKLVKGTDEIKEKKLKLRR